MLRYLCFLLTILGFSCSPNAANGQNKLSPDAFEAMLKNDTTVQLLDVRTPGEFHDGYIAGAKNLNIQDADFAQRITQLDKNRPVMVYCALGGRSANAAGQFSKLGFPKVYDLKGGMTAWKEKGKAVAN
ncbi:MAG: rhodanese-like domain-containing protein [Phycisphaerae bacterium]|nr:rhodanese-like domain-containing protein [Saprospiraceae bacterium]